MGEMFKITRLYTNSNGDSVFGEIEIPLRSEGEIGSLSEHLPVSGVIFRTTGPEYDYDFHNAPKKQYIILLDGIIEIETSTGEKRQFRGGDILLAEDIEGKGHRTRSVDGKLRRSIFITLD
jgi:hypothetical protein